MNRNVVVQAPGQRVARNRARFTETISLARESDDVAWRRAGLKSNIRTDCSNMTMDGWTMNKALSNFARINILRAVLQSSTAGTEPRVALG